MKTILKKSYILLLLVLLILTITSCGQVIEKPQTNDRDTSQKQVEILNEYINIRTEATTKSETLGKVYKGEIYTVLETDKFWLKIQTTNNITGWIISTYDDAIYVKYLETNGAIPEEQTTLDKIASGDYLDIEKIKYSSVDWISDVPLSEIKHIKYNDSMREQPKSFITKNGEIYEFSTEKIFTNEQVTKKIETNINLDRFHIYDNGYNSSSLIATDGTIYYFTQSTPITNIEKMYSASKCNLIKQMTSNYPLNYGDLEWGPVNYSIYYYVKDNQVYYYKARYVDSLSPLIVENDEVFATFPDGETCLAVEGKIFITDKAFYKIDVTNQDDLKKYEDAKPIYGLVKLESISNEYKKIAYFNGNYIIYKDDPNHLYIYR